MFAWRLSPISTGSPCHSIFAGAIFMSLAARGKDRGSLYGLRVRGLQNTVVSPYRWRDL
jgi:hypothetical protein